MSFFSQNRSSISAFCNNFVLATSASLCHDLLQASQQWEMFE